MSTSHIVALPGFVTIIRVVQLVLTILVLALVGNTINGFGGASYAIEPLSFMIFVCVWTLLVNAYLLATPLFLPVAYNMWAHLALECVSWLFWLAGFAAVADWASTWANIFSGSTGKIFGYWATSAAGAAMGAINWILFTITLVFFSLRLHKHRTDPNNQHLSGLGLPEKGENHQMGVVGGVQQPVSAAPTPYPQQDMGPTPVQYVATPPPQQWQTSPPPQGQQQY